jgi:hypothetical protein
MMRLLILIPLFLILACSKRTEEDNVRVLIPWPDASGKHTLQIVEINTLKDMRAMRGDAAHLYVHPGLNANGIEGVKPNALFAKSGGHYVPKDTETQEMFAIYAHMERLKQLDQEVGIDILLKWPRQIGVETLGIDPRNGDRIIENAMYVFPQDVMLFFPYSKPGLALSMNSGVIAHEHFHAVFQQVVIAPLALKFDDVETFGKEPKEDQQKPLTQEQIERRQISANNRFLLRAVNEGMADVWGSIYLGQLEFLQQSYLFRNRDMRPELLAQTALQGFVSMSFDIKNEGQHESQTYTLGTEYARLVRKALLESELDKKTKSEQAIFVIESMMRLRDIFLENYDKKMSADVLVAAVYSKEELNPSICEWLSPVLHQDSEYKKVCESVKDV